jgi:hypothetical protein
VVLKEHALMRYYAGPSTLGSQAQHMSIRSVMDAPDGGTQIGVAFDYGAPMTDRWYKIILRGTEWPIFVPGKFRLTGGEYVLILGTEGE